MNRYLREGLHAARTGRDLVLLDVETGLYDLLAGAGEQISVDPSGRRLNVRAAALDAFLCEVGLVVPEQDFQASLPLPALPTRSVLGGDVRPTGRERLAFIAAWVEMGVHYYGQGLPALLRRGHPRPVEPASVQRALASPLERQAAVFHQLSPWAPVAGDCVFRCFMLLRALQAKERAGVHWVFGVRTWPFYAHCWVQQGEVSLTDYAEPLVAFTPIFAL